jgi:hypothetical protein
MGDTSFYGKGLTVDTSKVFTVVTQFIGNPLSEIKRFYVQGGKLIPNSQSKIANVTGNSITTVSIPVKIISLSSMNRKERNAYSEASDYLHSRMSCVRTYESALYPSCYHKY